MLHLPHQELAALSLLESLSEHDAAIIGSEWWTMVYEWTGIKLSSSVRSSLTGCTLLKQASRRGIQTSKSLSHHAATKDPKAAA